MRITRGLASDRTRGSTPPAALTIGNFDGVHRAHRAMLERTVEAAADLSLVPTVLTFHPSPKEFFARHAGKPVTARLSTLCDKLERFAAAGIEHVVILEFDAALAQHSAEDFIARILEERLATRWLLVGDDFRFGHRRAGTIDTLRAARTFTVEQMHTVLVDGERVSSTAVRAALAAGRLDVAEKLLGRPYALTGRVAHGRKLGRTLGFPTANLPLRFMPPLSGICAVRVDGVERDATHPRYGVASLGRRPTVDATAQPVLEVFLFDFDRPIYGRRIRVTFLEKLRDEVKFADLSALTTQMRLDADEARRIVNERTALAEAA
jgi:riboflavin kinase/FMN adenylyltransferase